MKKVFDWRLCVADLARISNDYREFMSLVDGAEWIQTVDGLTYEEIANDYGFAISEDWLREEY